MREKNIPENVTKVTNLWFKGSINFYVIRSEMKFTERNKSYFLKTQLSAMEKRQCISSCNCVDKTTSPIISKFSDLFFLMNTVLLKFLIFTFKPKACEMDGNFRLQNGLNLLCRYSLVVHAQQDACLRLSLTLSTIFKICKQPSENAILVKLVNILSPQKFHLFLPIFSLVHHTVHMYTRTG